jgi:F0F1-type ATP synthase membrane subunit b/b'
MSEHKPGPIHKPGPMTYSGATWRALRLRHRLKQRWQQHSMWPFVIVLLLFWWLAVTLWYPIRFSIWLLKRDVRQHRKLREAERREHEAERHEREAERREGKAERYEPRE